MKTTLVLALEEDTAEFLEQMWSRRGNEEPNVFINRLLREERNRLGMGPKSTGQAPQFDASGIEDLTG